MRYLVSLSILITGLLYGDVAFAQDPNLPNDFLPKEFHKERREKLRAKMPPNSVAVFFANPIRNRANDVDYEYHPDPNFYYFTGYREPDALLLVFKEAQTAPNGASYKDVIFVRPRNTKKELWTGRRLGGKDAAAALGIDLALDNTEFEKFSVNFSQFDRVLFYHFQNDVRRERNETADLYRLIEAFKRKAGYVGEGDVRVALEQRRNNLDTALLQTYMKELRTVKTAEEIALIRRAVRISCQGQIEVMKAMKPGMSEREVQGIQEFVFKKYEAENVGYPSIVGAGNNGCILHYIDNYRPHIDPKDLILMDLGAEYHGYTADITRTVPIKGVFSEDQKAIYNLVLAAQEAAMKVCRAGATFDQLNAATRATINKGLKELGITRGSPHEDRIYYPHGCCHHIGLDVHDMGVRKATLVENMTFTIEPGIYIPENSNCDKRWWGIAVRIEDDFRATPTGCELLSTAAPRTVEAIEALMKQSSPLEKFVLPSIK